MSIRVARNAVPIIPTLALALAVLTATGCRPERNAERELYSVSFDEWVDLTFQTYAARLDYPGVYRVHWDGREGGRFIFVSNIDAGEMAFGETPIERTLLDQIRLMADTVRRDAMAWTERGHPKDHTEIRFIMRFPPKRDIEIPVWDEVGEVDPSVGV